MFDGYLGVPALISLQDIAPYPFLDVEPSNPQSAHAGLERQDLEIIGEQRLELTDRPDKVGVRLYAPEGVAAGRWSCRFDIDPPIGGSGAREAASSLQALFQALQAISTRLYGSDLYREGKLCMSLDRTYDLGPYERYLGIPAPHGNPELALFAF